MEVQTTPTIDKMMSMSEFELEQLIMDGRGGNDDARYVLGKLMCEGVSEQIKKNENKGLNWLKEAVKRNHLAALEYKTYWDIRFDRAPKLDKIVENLEKIIAANKSPRACNTLGELNHASASGQTANSTPEAVQSASEKKVVAANYYMTSAEQGDILGCHWLGVFYHEGFGVGVNMDKALKNLKIAADGGNGQSLYQLFLIHSGREGQSQDLKDVQKAYDYLVKAIIYGVTFFDDAISFFLENYDVLAPTYVALKKLPIEVKPENKKDILNMHDAEYAEMKVTFSGALTKDRMYHRPCGFINDQQIWMLGVQITYMLQNALRFSHVDFKQALAMDLGPILGDTGLWSLKCIQDQAKEQKDQDLKKKTQVAIELIQKYLENELEVLGDEKKYHYINKFSPKKCPKEQVIRGDIEMSYSWQHYAPLAWFDHQKKTALEIQSFKDGKPAAVGIYCSYCNAPEGTTIKHKVCAGCKQRFYCSVDCQRQDWKNSHNKQCKELQKHRIQK